MAERSYLLKVIDNTGWVFVERILRHSMGFVIGIWIARSLGPHDYGLFNYASAFVLLFAAIGALGVDPIVVRRLVKTPALRDSQLGTLLTLRLFGGVVMMLIISIAVLVVQPAEPRAPVLIAILTVAQVFLVTDSIDCWFQANVASRHTVAARLVSFFAASAVRVALILVDAPLVAFAWANLAEAVLLTAAMLLVYVRSGCRLTALRADTGVARTMVLEGWPLLLSAAVVAIAQRFDQVLLGQLGTYQDVGAYAVAVRIIEATYILPTVAAISVFPAMIKARAENPALFRAQTQRLVDVVVWLAIFIAVPLSILAGFIVQVLVGSAYAAAAAPLAILAWMPVFMFFSVVRQRWLIAEQAIAVSLVLEVAACVLTVVGNILLIPRLGASGAALAAVVGIVGATLLVAPFSLATRSSLGMLARGVAAPLRALRRG